MNHSDYAENHAKVDNMTLLLNYTPMTSPESTLSHHDGKPWDLLRQTPAMVFLLAVAYMAVFVLAIVNNSLVVSVIYRKSHMRTVTNYFIANLAIADILVSVLVLPITLLSNIYEGK